MAFTIGFLPRIHIVDAVQEEPLGWLKYVMHWEWWQVAIIVLLVFALPHILRSESVRMVLAFGLFLPLFYFSEWMDERKQRKRRRRY